MHWTWDETKAAANLRKHGVSFEMAERVLGDPLAVTLPDPYPDEERWRTIGMPSSAGSTVLFVVHTLIDDDLGGGRIISARRALPHERKAYEEGQF
ncbi:MAG: BrnT family toxin [Asticcacaulis sp.]